MSDIVAQYKEFLEDEFEIFSQIIAEEGLFTMMLLMCTSRTYAKMIS